jgi:hypothetical protein
MGGETPIALRYPNGRVHETTLNRDLLPGEQFEMYGRAWTAVRTRQVRGNRVSRAVQRVVCVTVESPARTQDAAKDGEAAAAGKPHT